MKKVEITSEFIEFDSIEELSESDRNLVMEAMQSASKAYAPYSRFLVGAAVLLENGIILRGNNAQSGETLKSFITGLRMDKVLSQMKKGDYFFIQFGWYYK